MYLTRKTGEMEKILEIKNLYVGRIDGTKILPVLNNIELSIYKGELFCLVGESGSGKTTLALSIIRLLPKSFRILSGEIILCNKKITGISEELIRGLRGKFVSMIFQDPGAYLDPLFNIDTHLRESFHGNPVEFNQLKIKVITEVGLSPEILSVYPHQLSGGQQQRVLIAMALINNPSIIIADEPTTALDVLTTKQIIKLLDQIRIKHNPGMLFITHDLNLALSTGTRIGIMYRGCIVEIFKPNKEKPLHPYTKILMGYSEENHSDISDTTLMDTKQETDEKCIFFERCPEKKPLCNRKVDFIWRDETTGIRCIKYGQNSQM
ncbi:MAG TPA: ABC transporter ATP-binding protein [Candidatus Ratteibacteria bacterium]|nr:ABC transporter ATP-binding protein [Candidatus Ratteibacteria bacterium]